MEESKIDTDGGAHVGNNVNAGQDFVGRDQNIININNDGSADARTAAEILNAIRDRNFMSGILSEREVSLVYIDRHIRNYVGGGRESVAQTADTLSDPPRRIGDMVINPVPRWEQEKICQVYVPPMHFAETLVAFQTHRFTILYGRKGAGKRATALYLLTKATQKKSDSAAIFELNPEIHLSDVRPDDLPADTALLLEVSNPNSLEGLRSFHINALRNALNTQERNSSLVIVTNHLPAGFPVEHRGIVREWLPGWETDRIVTQRTIIAQHLRYLARHDASLRDIVESKIDEMQAWESLNRLLIESLTFTQLSELAELLLPVVCDQMPLEKAVVQFEINAYQEVQNWFHTAPPDSPELENLLIATAVLNGAAYDDINNASRRLGELLDRQTDDDQEDAPARPGRRFHAAGHRESRVAAIRARRIPSTVNVHFGEVTHDALVLENSGWQEAVLRYVWEFDDFRQPLLSWLDELATYPVHAVRVRSAAAVGALARLSFSTIETSLLRKWSNSHQEWERRAAAQVLGITIWDEIHTAATSGLLRYWSSQQQNPRYQWTAATAYSGLAGLRYPQQTLADLKRIAANTSQYPDLLEPVFQCLLNFYSASKGMPERRLALLRELTAWTLEGDTVRTAARPPKDLNRDQLKSVQRTALLGFWVMLWPERRDPVWRQLLFDIGIPGELRNCAILLIRQSLNFRQRRGSVNDGLHPRRLAHDGLQALMTHVVRSGEPELHQYLAGVLQALIADCAEADRRTGGEEVERLRSYAQEWADPTSEITEFAKILL